MADAKGEEKSGDEGKGGSWDRGEGKVSDAEAVEVAEAKGAGPGVEIDADTVS